MKKISLKKLIHLMSIMMLVSLVTVSCKKDDPEPDPDPIIVLDGIYLTGAGTALVDLDEKGMLKATKNEVNQTDRASLLEIFVAVKAGADGFNIVKVAGATKTTYGPGADFVVVGEADRVADDPKVDFQRGSYAETETKFTVPADGLYHVVMDTELGKVVVVPVQYWGLIGAATPGGWTSDTQIPPVAFDLNTMTFEVTDVVMTKSNWKFRYSGGWKVVLDGEVDLGGGIVGVKVNTNYGGAVNALVPGGLDIANEVSGKYTAKMVWTLGAGYTATLTKTGDLEVFDYSNIELGLVGNSLIVDGAPHNWNESVMLHTPVVTNETTYTWTFTNVEVGVDSSGFKIREGQTWDNKSYGYNNVVMAGLAAENFTDNGGNFLPVAAGVFDIVFEINAITEIYKFTVNPAGAAPEMFILGDGSLAGWDNAAALPMVGADGVYSITTTLLGAGKYIKFITTLGQWAPMYGTDAAGTSTAGNLVFRPTESDPDPASIPAPDVEGVYTITINTNNLTYNIAAPLYMLGDGCTAGWDNTAALPMFTAGNGVYFLNTALGAGLNIKFITTLGAWEPMYGYATGTPEAGTLVYRAPGAADVPNIVTPATAGNYVVTADITNLTYTVAAAK